MDKLSVTIWGEVESIKVTGTTVDLEARVSLPVVPPPPPYVPIEIKEVQTPRTTWDDLQIDPARPYGTKPDFKIFRQDTR